MNPSDRKTPVSTETRERIEAWLRYSQTLGITYFFLDRTVSNASVPELQAPAAVEPAVAEAASDGTIVDSPVEVSVAPIKKPVAESTKRAITAPPALPIVESVSLFEESDRIEGDTFESIRDEIGDCVRCRLHKKRTNIVFGVGNPKAELVFVGEGPGHDEDVQGIPFVGRAGKLLTQMIEAMGLRREDVYICNVVKCRPPENRTPEKDEMAVCSPFLVRQIDVIRPKAIVALGSVAAQTLLNTNQSLSRFRGEWREYRGARLMCTYHPAYLLRNPNAKGEVWKDLQKVMALLGLQPPKKPAQKR